MPTPPSLFQSRGKATALPALPGTAPLNVNEKIRIQKLFNTYITLDNLNGNGNAMQKFLMNRSDYPKSIFCHWKVKLIK